MKKSVIIGIVVGVIVLAVVGFMIFGGNTSTNSTTENQEASVIALNKLSAAEVKQELIDINDNQASYNFTRTTTKTGKGSSGAITLDMTLSSDGIGNINRQTKEYTFNDNVDSNTNGRTEKSTWIYALKNGVMNEKINQVSQPSSQEDFEDYDLITRFMELLGDQELSEEGNYYVLKLNPDLGKLLNAIYPALYKDFSGTTQKSELRLYVDKANNLIEKAIVDAEFEEGIQATIKNEYTFAYQAKEQNREQESNQNNSASKSNAVCGNGICEYPDEKSRKCWIDCKPSEYDTDNFIKLGEKQKCENSPLISCCDNYEYYTEYEAYYLCDSSGVDCEDSLDFCKEKCNNANIGSGLGISSFKRGSDGLVGQTLTCICAKCEEQKIKSTEETSVSANQNTNEDANNCPGKSFSCGEKVCCGAGCCDVGAVCTEDLTCKCITDACCKEKYGQDKHYTNGFCCKEGYIGSGEGCCPESAPYYWKSDGNCHASADAGGKCLEESKAKASAFNNVETDSYWTGFTEINFYSSGKIFDSYRVRYAARKNGNCYMLNMYVSTSDCSISGKEYAETSEGNCS